MIINDLQSKAIKAAELKTDHRWSKWAKWVDSVNPQGQDGYAFKGDFVNDGTLEVKEESLPRVILCCAITGSRKNQSKEYAVVILTKAGEVENTNLGTNDAKGWALRLRDPLIGMLNTVAQQREPAKQIKYVDIKVSEETTRRLALLQERVGEPLLDRLINTLISAFQLPGDATRLTSPAEEFTVAEPSTVEPV